MRVAAFDMGVRHFGFIVMDLEDGYVRMLDLHDFSSSADVYRDLIHHLHRFDRYWEEVSVVLVEQQMNRHNVQATRMACHVMAFFYHCFPGMRVIEYPSIYKTRLLGGKHLDYKGRKVFAVRTVTTMYEQDPVLLDWMDALPKNDDIADCILMCRTFPMSPFSS